MLPEKSKVIRKDHITPFMNDKGETLFLMDGTRLAAFSYERQLADLEDLCRKLGNIHEYNWFTLAISINANSSKRGYLLFAYTHKLGPIEGGLTPNSLMSQIQIELERIRNKRMQYYSNSPEYHINPDFTYDIVYRIGVSKI